MIAAIEDLTRALSRLPGLGRRSAARALCDKNDERNDIIVGIEEDYKTIEEYVDHARKLIAKINSVDIDDIIVEDYKLFGPFLQFLTI